MHDVSKAINILDPTKTIDAKICKTGTGSVTSISSTPESAVSGGKCASHDTAASSGRALGLEKLTGTDNSITGFEGTVTMSVLPKTSTQIVQDVSSLNKDQKGVVSSAFAKALEGVEIVIAVDIHH